MKWISVDERLPEEYETCFLKWTYPNGNTGNAVGCLDDDEWEIEWSDDHPQSKHISHWLDERSLTSRPSRAAESCEIQGHVFYEQDNFCFRCGTLKPPPA